MDHHILFEEVDFIYNPRTPFAVSALHNINVAIPSRQVTAIVGHTGSGKSTLIQHLNVLVRPTNGSVTISGERITAQSKHGSLKPLRKKVGVVFQFPEAQLFEETVLKDVMFGPLNFGVQEEEAKRIAKEKLNLVGIEDALFERSPFELSGGQMRRVAIAGVLALEPEVLVLDEPTAGLDPLGHQRMMALFADLQKRMALTLVLVTHQMNDVAKYADNVIVMEGGTVVATGTPAAIFADEEAMAQRQLGLPHTLRFLKQVSEQTQLSIPAEQMPLTVEALATQLIQMKEANEHVR
ncbi:energy-coupling factor ABC transporter ATP-binding protein [Aerococcaceae bacterium NML191219]|nr:energy-coupling factor ABC transporter ATP-binding protein [Aerococcaceae bacterium NML191219]